MANLFQLTRGDSFSAGFLAQHHGGQCYGSSSRERGGSLASALQGAAAILWVIQLLSKSFGAYVGGQWHRAAGRRKAIYASPPF
jgi:hypothetical protein